MTVVAADIAQAAQCLAQASSTGGEAAWSVAPATRRRGGKVPAHTSACSRLPTSSPSHQQAQSGQLVQQLLLPGADRKGKMEGSSCLPGLGQVWRLEKAAPWWGLLSWGRDGGWVVDMMLSMGGTVGTVWREVGRAAEVGKEKSGTCVLRWAQPAT